MSIKRLKAMKNEILAGRLQYTFFKPGETLFAALDPSLAMSEFFGPDFSSPSVVGRGVAFKTYPPHYANITRRVMKSRALPMPEHHEILNYRTQRTFGLYNETDGSTLLVLMRDGKPLTDHSTMQIKSVLGDIYNSLPEIGGEYLELIDREDVV